MGLIQMAIPFFFLLIAVELIAALLVRRRVYRINDSLADLGCGLLQQFAGLATILVLLHAYALFVEHASLPALLGQQWWTSASPIVGLDTVQFGAGLLIALTVLVLLAVLTKGLLVPLVGTSLACWGLLALVGVTTLEITWWAALSWFVAWVLYDKMYYWAHRKMHEIGVGWATHAPHHSSEEYNLTVALRQGAFQRLFSTPFFIPLALIGIPWELFLVVGAITTLYQFWIHTRLVTTIGPLEWILNTPSHHRVHHGCEPKYIDKNHAGTFIVWDRLFGTFQPEEEEPTYGLVKQLHSFNPVWAQLHVFRDLFRESRRCRNVLDVARVWLGPPGWRPDYCGGPLKPMEIDRESYKPYDVAVPWMVAIYCLAHFVVVMGAMLTTLSNSNLFTTWELVSLGVIFALALSNIGELFARRRWAYFAEQLRLGVIAVIAGIGLTNIQLGSLPVTEPIAMGVLAGALFSMLWLFALRHAFDRSIAESDHVQDDEYSVHRIPERATGPEIALSTRSSASTDGAAAGHGP